MQSDRGGVGEVVVYRDRGLWLATWGFLALAAAGALVAAMAGRSVLAAVLLVAAACAAIVLHHRLPRVELHEDCVSVHSFVGTDVPYDDIEGFRVGSVWWWGRSGLILVRGFGHETPIPPGLGLSPPRWHLALRDEIARRTPRQLM